MLEIKLFGTGHARYNQQTIQDFPNQQSFLLFCYLLLYKKFPHHREHLSTLFWADSTTRIARKRLRNAIWRLRYLCEPVGLCIDDYFLIDDDTISFINTSDYWLDLEAFDSGTEKCKGISGRKMNENQAAILEISIQHYIGDLLEGNYEDWVLYERERYRMAYLNALYKLMVYHGCIGNYEEGLFYGEEILARDITREKVHRQMMWLYSLANNRDAAIKQFKRCRQILKDELGIPPMLETQKIYALILQNKFKPESWDGDARLPAHANPYAYNSICTLVRSALEKLNQLQETIEGTTTELLLVEQMITETLAKTSQQARKSQD